MPASRDSLPGSSKHRRKSAPGGLKIATREYRSPPPRPSTAPRANSSQQDQGYKSECIKLKIPRLHPMQKSVIEAIVNHPHKDRFVIAATGSGKSILFELPAILPAAAGKITIVFIPRIAIIRMELERLISCGITAVARYGKKNNTAGFEAQNELLFDGMQNPSRLPRILLVTPHQLEHTETTLQALLDGLHERKLIQRFVFDEIHMLLDKSQLIEYLCALRAKFPDVPATILSASLSPTTAHDLKGILKLNCGSRIFPLDRPNIYYSVWSKYSSGETSREKGDQNLPTKKDMSQLQPIIYLANMRYSKGAGLVYCRSKQACKRMANLLTLEGIPAQYFDSERGDTGEGYEVLRKWIQNDPTVRVIVSTVALSSGVHKPDVRFVVHTSFPTSGIDAYMQETGRAGRDGREATCILCKLYAFGDAFKVLQDTQYETENIYSLLHLITSSECRRRHLLSYYNDEHYAYNTKKARCCDVCDNQISSSKHDLDITGVARRVLQFYSNFEQKNGSIGAQTLAEKLQRAFGSGQKTTVDAWKKIVHLLIIERYLEKDRPGVQGGGQVKVVRGPRTNNILRAGPDTIWLPWSMQFHEHYLGKPNKDWPRLWTEEIVARMTEIEVNDSSREVSPEL